MASAQKGDKKVLKFVACLRILLFLKNRSIVHFCEGEVGVGGGGQKISYFFCGCHICMITNVKKVMVLVMSLVPMLL